MRRARTIFRDLSRPSVGWLPGPLSWRILLPAMSAPVRSSRCAALAIGGVTVAVFGLAEACGGSGPSRSEPSDAGTGGISGPSGLPCDVDRVLAQNCRKCHASPPQFGAPMPLFSWDDLNASSERKKKIYELSLERVTDGARPMPPPPNPPLSAADRQTLGDWVASGAPRSSAVCNHAGSATEGLSCIPDVSLAPASEWEMPQDTADEYVCWGVDLAKDSPTHITAFAPKIDNPTIVHHVVVYEAPSSHAGKPTPCSAGSALAWRMVLGWAPGAKGLELPPDVGFPIAKSPAEPTHYVVQVHYSNINRLAGQKDRSTIELCTSSPRKYEADVMAFGSQRFTIPPLPARGGRYTIDCSLQVPQPLAGLHFFAAMPHMHKLGVAMSTTLTPAGGGAPVDLGTMSSFSFDTQAWLPIDAVSKGGDTIRTSCSWVNVTGAPVGFGERTEDEMCYSFTLYYPRIEASFWSWAAPTAGSPAGATCTE